MKRAGGNKGAKKSANLDGWRKKIDQLDGTIVMLLGERAKCAMEIGRIKSAEGLPVLDPVRETQVLENLKSQNRILPNKSLEAIYREIFSASRALEKPVAIAYLGPAGTFSYEAAVEIFGVSSEFRPCQGFENVFNEVEKGLADYGVLPIENSIEGNVNANLDLLKESTLFIHGEKTIVAHQNLASRLKSGKSAVRLYSHPQPLGQCRRFIARELAGIDIVETSSTAAAAEKASFDPNSVAICSVAAASNYRLNLLQERIEDFPNNNTRFIVISRHQMKRTGRDKTSIVLTIKNRPGELYRLLEVFKKAGINLSKIASRPLPKSNWGYIFFIDFEGHRTDLKVENTLKKLGKTGESLKILGSYPREA